MKITFIRHGQTNYNLKDLCNGKPNPKVKLTALGKEQATKAAKLLKNEKFEVIFVSALYRSSQTARIINAKHGVPVIKDKRLNDRSMGVFENRPATLFYTWRDKQKNLWTCRPRGGETYEEMKKRFALFMKDLAKTGYTNVLVVTHLPIIKVARGFFKKLSNEAMDRLTEKDIPNCKTFVFNYKIAK